MCESQEDVEFQEPGPPHITGFGLQPKENFVGFPTMGHTKAVSCSMPETLSWDWTEVRKTVLSCACLVPVNSPTEVACQYYPFTFI